MGKVARLRREKNTGTAAVSPKEGLMFFSFHFDGIRHVQSHQLSPSEVDLLKKHHAEFGPDAINQIVSKMAIKGAAILGQNLIARAMLRYIKDYYKPPVVAVDEAAQNMDEEVTTAEVMAKLAESQGIVLDPHPEDGCESGQDEQYQYTHNVSCQDHVYPSPVGEEQ